MIRLLILITPYFLITFYSCGVSKINETPCEITKEIGILNIKPKLSNGIRFSRTNGERIEELLIEYEQNDFQYTFTINNFVVSKKAFSPEKTLLNELQNLSINYQCNDIQFVQNCSLNIDHSFIDSIYFVSRDTLTLLYINVSGPTLKKSNSNNGLVNSQDFKMLAETYELFNHIRTLSK
jgi:hypothetical protein